MDPASVLRSVYPEVLAACDAGAAMRRHWPGETDAWRSVGLLALGKAAWTMARAAATRLGGRLVGGVVVVPEAHRAQAWDGLPACVEVVIGDHPSPTARSVAAGEAVMQAAAWWSGAGSGPGWQKAGLESAQAASPEGVVVLLSGGASAMVCAPRSGLVLSDIAELNGALLASGAPIEEINTVRRACDRLKGGGLARLLAGVPAVVLVVSDVPGDRLEAVGSGPCMPSPTGAAEAIAVLERRGIDLPRVRGALRGMMEEAAGETPAIEHRVVASNALAVGAAADRLRGRGVVVEAARTRVRDDAGEVGRGLAAWACAHAADRQQRAIVLGGETALAIPRGAGDALGGRCQHAALAAAIGLDGVERVAVLCLATDGVDGPTDAAGAVVDGATAGLARRAGVDPTAALTAFRSHAALNAAGSLLRTGPTGTNVNEVFVALAGG